MPTASAYLIGETAGELAGALDRAGVPYARCGDLAAAVAAAADRRRPGRRRPALAGLRELRPVPRLRAARRGVQEAGAEPVRVKRGQLESNVLVLVTLALVAFGMVMVYSATSASAAIGERQPDLLPQAPGDLRAARARRCWSSPRRWNYRPLRTLAPVLVVGSLGPAAGRARRRPDRERRAAVDHVRPGDLPAVRAREARARGLGRARTSRGAPRRGRSASCEARSGCSRPSSAPWSWPSPTSAP